MNLLLGFSLVAGLCLVGIAHGADALPTDIKAGLQTAKEIYIATKRATGEWSAPAPVWFMYDGEGIYFTTSPTSYKARRIQRGSPVRIWVGSAEGPAFTGEAQMVKDRTIVERMGEAYTQKYWIAWIGLFRPRVSRVESGKTVAIKVTPLPDTSSIDPAEEHH